MVRAPAARARFRIASVAAIGVSNCATQTSSSRGSWRTISLVKWRLAPEATVMALSPWATWISATPVAGPSISRTPEQSTSLSARKARRLLAKASLPTAPIIAVGTPSRAAATAWLRPLPPGRNDTVAPSSVSPGGRPPRALHDDVHVEAAADDDPAHQGRLISSRAGSAGSSRAGTPD